MTDTKKDNNQIPALLGTSNTDGSTPIPFKVVPTTHLLKVKNGDTGSDLSGDNAARDNNGEPVAMGVSSVDGITPVQIYADSTTGELLIKSS